MDDLSKEELVKNGMQYLDDALSYFMEIKGCEKGSVIANVVHGAIVLAESLYEIKKK